MNELARNDGQNFDMQQLMNIVGQNALTTGQINKQLGLISGKVDSLSSEVIEMRNDIDQLKLNEEITTAQCKNLKNHVDARVYELLGTNNKNDMILYFGFFCRRLWSDAKKYTGMASEYKSTKKGDYQSCIDYIDAWMPVHGVNALKIEADELRIAKAKAKEF